jgi:hypothetical protein
MSDISYVSRREVGITHKGICKSLLHLILSERSVDHPLLIRSDPLDRQRAVFRRQPSGLTRGIRDEDKEQDANRDGQDTENDVHQFPALDAHRSGLITAVQTVG